MIREEVFRISHLPYAVDPLSLHVEPRESGGVYATVEAVWFRRRKGKTVACTGLLWDFQKERPETALDFVQVFADGRYGGDCKGRWDGERYWGGQEPVVIDEHLRLLRPMLENYPAIPPGYNGWWRF